MSALDDLFSPSAVPEHGSALGDLACIAWEGFKIFCIGAAVVCAAPILCLLVIMALT